MQNIEHSLLQKIENVRNRYYYEKIAEGLFSTIIIFLLLFSGMCLLEYVFHFDSTVRTIFFFTNIFIVGLLISLLIGKPLLQFFNILKKISIQETALIIGKHFSDIKDRLWNILEITQNQKEQLYSSELINASLLEIEKLTENKNFNSIITFSKTKKLFQYFCGIVVGIFFLFFFPHNGMLDAAHRIVQFNQDFKEPPSFYFTIKPGNVEVVKGDSVQFSITLSANTNFSELPKEITLSVFQKNITVPENFILHKDSANTFTHTIFNLKETSTYYAQSENIQSNAYTITVTDRPFIRSFSMDVTAPSYSKLPPQRYEDNGDASALAGSTIRWEIIPSKPLSKIFLTTENGDTIPFTSYKEKFVGKFFLKKSTSYTITLFDKEGISNTNLIRYTLEVLPDMFPTVAITEPGKNMDVAGTNSLPMQIKIADDFGFSSLHLAYRLTNSRYEKPQEKFSIITIPINKYKNIIEIIPYLWNISSLNLVPEDVIEYYAEVFDNDNINGPKMGKSDVYLLRLPSLEEVFANAEKNVDETLEHLDTSLDEAEQLKKQLDEVSQEMKKNQAMDWQKQKKIEEMVKNYENLQKKMDEMNKTLEQTTQELQQHNALSSETLKKYNELQQMMQEMQSPEFQQAMKELQNAMQKLSPQQMQQAMQQAQFFEEKFRQSIERTLELLKRVQIEQKMDEMVKRANDLLKKQEGLQKETEKLTANDTKKSNELAEKQNDVNKELENLQKELSELKSKMEDFPKEMPLQKMDEAQRSANDSKMEQAMQQSSQQLRSQQKQQAQQSQQQAAKGLQQMSQQFAEMQEQLLNNQMMETMKGLEKAKQDMLQLSQQQEQLKNQSQNLPPNSQQFRENSQKQNNLRSDLSKIANSLTDLSKKSFAVTPEMGKAMGKAMANMNEAMEGLEQRNGQLSGMQQGEAMGALNEAAMSIQSAMNAMQSGGQGGGGSLLQQLQKLSGQQQGINGQTQQLGQGLSQEQMQQIGRLAAQQDAVRKSLEQLQKEAQRSPDKNKILGDLQKIGDEMKEVVEKMRQNNVNPETKQQQERILSRLLNAQHSLRERDFKEQHKASTGKNFVRQSPAEIQKKSTLDKLRMDLQKAIEEGYVKEYQELIRKYYDSINN